MSSDVKYPNLFSGRSVQNIPRDLGFSTFHAADCGLQSCLRNTIHFHCRFCGYGTSQIGNLVPHRRLCSQGTEMPLKDPPPPQHDIAPPPTQSYSYYSTVSSAGQPSSSQSSKMITSQQSAMFNFVLPPQTSQYGGLYGSQTVFPNPSLFSPSSFNGFGQLDPSWPRLIPPPGNTQTSDLTRHFDKLDASISPNCCSRIGQLENTAIGLCSPLTAEAYKVVSKEYQNKMEPQNWYCSSQSIMGFNMQNGQQSSCKLSENPPSCSISLLLLEQNDLKQAEECINVDDLCFESSPKPEVKQEMKDNLQEFSSCMQASKSELYPMPVKTEHVITPGLLAEENIDLESMTSSEESDIVVEESESDVTDSSDSGSVVAEGDMEMRCLVCHGWTSSVALSSQTPVTNIGLVPVLTKLSSVVDTALEPTDSQGICSRCLGLVNNVDHFETKLSAAKSQLLELFNSSKDNAAPERDAVDITPPPKLDETWNKLMCRVCNKQFSSASYLEKHQQHHTKSFSYYCEYCGRGFAVLRKLENHIHVHCGSSRYQCEICGRRFIQKHALTDHLNRHRGDLRYKCNVCDKAFVRKSVLNVHLRIHADETLMCQFCGKRFKVAANLSVHLRLCSGDLRFRCLKCDKGFPIESLLKRHVQARHDTDQPHTCSVCKKGYVKESDLKAHLRSHSTNKPFSCDQCDRRYKTLSNLNHHRKVHSQIQALRCHVCAKEFTRKDFLEDHLNQHNGRTPYKCTICWKSFANRINYNTHTKRHQGALKQTPCPVCGKLFVKGLKDHLATHSNSKAYSCSHCSATFTVKSSLNKHIKTKHGLPL